MIKEYKAYSDDAHGWLRVEKTTLKRLGLLDKISSLSYEDDEYIYLEEDLDADVFLNTQKDEDFGIDEHYSPKSSIRKKRFYKGGLQ
mgnify:CR=1 FL=1